MKSQHFTYAMAFIALFTCLGCFPTATETIDEEIVELKGTKWKLVSPKDLEGSLEFNEELTRVSGFNGCNTFSADLILKNYEFAVDKFVVTERYCADKDAMETEFMYLLSKVEDYTANKKSLRLVGDMQQLMRFERVEN